MTGCEFVRKDESNRRGSRRRQKRLHAGDEDKNDELPSGGSRMQVLVRAGLGTEKSVSDQRETRSQIPNHQNHLND